MFGTLLAKYDEELLTLAFKYFRTLLDLDKHNIPIEFKAVNTMRKGVGATCAPVFTDKSTWRNLELKSIEIKLAKTVCVSGMIESLAHEMIHAKQFINGELVQKIEKRYYFFGLIPYLKSVRYWKGDDMSDTPYFERGYEREAFLYQRRLIGMFFKHYEQAIDPKTMADILIPKVPEQKL